MQRTSRKSSSHPNKNNSNNIDDGEIYRTTKRSKKPFFQKSTTIVGGRPVTLRTEVNDFFTFLAKTARSLSRWWRNRSSGSSSHHQSTKQQHNAPYLPSLIPLGLVLGLSGWYILHGGDKFRGPFRGNFRGRNRVDLCRRHRSRDKFPPLTIVHRKLPSEESHHGAKNTGIRFATAPRLSKFNSRNYNTDAITPDYGGISLRLSGPYIEATERITSSDDYFWREYGTYEDKTNWDHYYDFDDDDTRNNPWKKDKMHCRRVAWHKLYNPSCNQMHETDVMTPSNGNKFLGAGFYRDVFLNRHPDSPNTVLKLSRAKQNPFSYDRYEFIRMDALIMERLTASPRIPDIYGHCGTSMVTEHLPYESEPLIIPGSGKFYKKDGVPFPPGNDTLVPYNNFKPEDKIQHALAMAEALSDLHGFRDGVIVHDDLQPSQFLYSEDGMLKLNDFNRGEAMLFDEERGSYCRYRNGKGGGDFRAPEEYRDGRLNEKIDVFSLGNMMYGLLTGLEVFYDVREDKELQKKLVKGELTYIDPRWRTTSYADRRLVEIIEKCWMYDPNDRADVFEVTRFLSETLATIQRQKGDSK